MPRPRKCRRVCQIPRTCAFVPSERGELPPVVLSVDEYETIRLIDREGLSQEACGEQMHIARTTVQQIYASARGKLAEMLVEGLPLKIEGGDYRICGGENGRKNCRKCFKGEKSLNTMKAKGEATMKIAVTYENGLIFQHFGHTQQFKVYDVEAGRVVDARVVDTNGSGHGALAGVLNDLQADILICGGIGGGAQMALAEAGIQLYGGVAGEADAAVEALLAGKLNFNPNVRCDHHGENHHHGGSCGDHGCGGEHHCH